MPILFACISHNSTLLCQFTQTGINGNFATIAENLLEQLSSSAPPPKYSTSALGPSSLSSFAADEFIFHLLSTSPFYFLALCDKEFPSKVVFEALNEVRTQFLTTYKHLVDPSANLVPSSAKMDTAALLAPDKSGTNKTNFEYITNALQTDFSSVLSRIIINYSVNDPRLRQMQQDVVQVSSKMIENLDKVFERGEKLDNLVEKSSELERRSIKFKQNSTALARSLWWKDAKLVLVSGAAVGGILFLFLQSICGGFSLPEC